MRWPNKCVTCGGNATTRYTSYGSSLAGYKFWLIYHEIEFDREDIFFPICQKHKYTTMIIRLFYFISFIPMIGFGFVTLLFLGSSLGQSSIFGLREGVIFCSIFLISFVVFIGCRNLQPVRLKDIGKHFFTIVVRHEQYAKEFALLNGLDPL